MKESNYRVKIKKSWFSELKYTPGKIYNFPEFTDDRGYVYNLNPNKSEWVEEFEFLDEVSSNVEIINNYEIY